MENEHNGKRLASIIAELILKGALQGRLDYLREVIDRTEGRAKERVEVSGGSLFIIHVPSAEIIGHEAHRRAVEEAERHAPENAKILVGDFWVHV